MSIILFVFYVYNICNNICLSYKDFIIYDLLCISKDIISIFLLNQTKILQRIIFKYYLLRRHK